MSAFLAVFAIFLLGLVSPGPDLAFITKQGLTRSRSAAAWSALGIAASNLVHIGYCMLGIGVLITQSILLFNVIKIAGAIYLMYIGMKAILHTPAAAPVLAHEARTSGNPLSPTRDFTAGFLCNILNPKCTLFFLALFTQVIDPATPLLVQAGMGFTMATTAFLWFALLGFLLNLDVVRRPFRKIQTIAERVMGAFLVAFGLRLAYTTQE